MRIAVIFASLMAINSAATAAELKWPLLEEVLTAPAELRFDKAKIRDVVISISRGYRIEMVVDEKSLEDAALTNEPVSGSAKCNTLAEALTALLSPHHLGWTIEDDVVSITTREQLPFRRITRIYRATDAKSAQKIAAEMPKRYKPGTWTGVDNRPYAHAYGRAVIIRHNAEDHVSIGKSFADELTLAKGDGSSLLPATLCQQRDVEFVDAKLCDVAAWLEKQSGLKVRIHERSLNENNLDPQMRFTANAKHRSLSNGLTTVLAQHNLQWFVRDEVLTIASDEDPIEVHAVHDIRSLVLDDDYNALQDFILTNVTFWREQSGPPPIHFAVPHHVVIEADYQEQLQLAKKLEALRVALRKD